MIDILLPVLKKIGEDAEEPIGEIVLSHRIPASIRTSPFEESKDSPKGEGISKVYEIDRTEYEGQKFLVEEPSGKVQRIRKAKTVADSNLVWLYC